jgi:uncharacterized membrane protein
MPFINGIGPGEIIILFIIAAMIGVPILVLVLVVRGSRPVSPQAGPSWGTADPRAVLAERLARGEITREEFDTAMRALGYLPPAR